jgi:hypothetical protein
LGFVAAASRGFNASEGNRSTGGLSAWRAPFCPGQVPSRGGSAWARSYSALGQGDEEEYGPLDSDDDLLVGMDDALEADGRDRDHDLFN